MADRSAGAALRDWFQVRVLWLRLRDAHDRLPHLRAAARLAAPQEPRSPLCPAADQAVVAMTAPVGVVMARAAELDRRYREASKQRVKNARPATVGPCPWCAKKNCRQHGDLDRLLALYQRGYDL